MIHVKITLGDSNKHPEKQGKYLFMFNGEECVVWHNKIEFYVEDFEDIDSSLLIDAEEYTIKYSRSILLNKLATSDY